MAQVIEIKTVRGAEMMFRGKIGNQVFQVRNGKQIDRTPGAVCHSDASDSAAHTRTMGVVAKGMESRLVQVQRKEIQHVTRVRLCTAVQGMDVSAGLKTREQDEENAD